MSPRSVGSSDGCASASAIPRRTESDAACRAMRPRRRLVRGRLTAQVLQHAEVPLRGRLRVGGDASRGVLPGEARVDGRELLAEVRRPGDDGARPDARREAAVLILRRALRHEHDVRRREPGVRSHAAAEFEPVGDAHHQIREHDARAVRARRGEHLLRGVRGPHAKSRAGEPEAAEPEQGGVVRRDHHVAPSRRRRRHEGATEVGVHHADEARGLHGLREEVHGALGPRAEVVEARGQARHDEDRHVRAPAERAHRTDELEPVHVREHEVLQDEVRPRLLEQREGAGAVPRLADAVPLALERDAEHAPRDRVVLHDQDVADGVHGPPPPSRGAAPAQPATSAGNVRVSMGFET
jgi:hypothetical protein